jgi:spermidine synthase
MNPLVGTCIFLSGVAALIYQIAWQRVLIRLLGATLPAITIVLTLFMGGLAVGSMLAGAWRRKSGAPLKIYAFVEGILAVGGFAFPSFTNQAVFSHFNSLAFQIAGIQSISSGHLAGALDRAHLLLLPYLVLLVFVPAMLMGTTLPLVARHIDLLCSRALDHERAIEANLSGVYTLNLLGAALGAFFCGFVLLPQAGLTASIFAAASLNALAAVLLSFAFRRAKRDYLLAPDEQNIERGVAHVLPGGARISLLALVYAVGLTSMMLEVAWTRLFCLILGSSTYALSTVLVVLLIALAVSALIVQRIVALVFDVTHLLSLASLAAALALIGQLWSFQSLPARLIQVSHFLNSLGLAGVTEYLATRFVVVSLLILLPCLCLGLVFPLTLAKAKRHGFDSAAWTGQLYAASTLGSICGAMLAGFILIPHPERLFLWLKESAAASGIETTILCAAVMQLATALLVLKALPLQDKAGKKQFVGAMVACAAAGMGLVVARPQWSPAIMSGGIAFAAQSFSGSIVVPDALARWRSAMLSAPIIYYREGLNSTVTVVKAAQNLIQLKNDGKVEASVPVDQQAPSPGSDIATQNLLGILPLLLLPDKCNDALVIGYGSGTTSEAMIKSGLVAGSLVAAEIEEAVVKARPFFGRPLEAGRDRGGVVIADGRNLLCAPGKYSVIVSQPPEPWVNGAADLYSLEFWQLVNEKLDEHGIFCQWIQLYGIDTDTLQMLLMTFHDAFARSYVFRPEGAGEILLVGFKDGSRQQFDWAKIQQSIDHAFARRVCAQSGIESWSDLAAMIALRPDDFDSLAKPSKTELNVDDRLLCEFRLPAAIASGESAIKSNLAFLAEFRHGNENGPVEPARVLCSRAESDIAQGNFALALSRLRSADRGDSIFSRAACDEATALIGLKQPAEAIAAVQKAIGNNPNNFRANYILGVALYASGDESAALKQMAIASALQPSEAHPNAFVTALYALRGDVRQAGENLAVLERKDPTGPDTRLLARALQAGRLDDPDLKLEIGKILTRIEPFTR